MISKLLKKNEKGFTLMEMLIVVAIIAVLVAIAIPTFNSSLNKAKVATDQANIRAGYATVMLKSLEANTATAKSYVLKADGDVVELTTTAPDGAYKTVGKNDSTSLAIGGITVGSWDVDKYVVYNYAADGKLTITISNTGTTTQNGQGGGN